LEDLEEEQEDQEETEQPQVDFIAADPEVLEEAYKDPVLENWEGQEIE